MLGRTVGVVAASALGASAFLIAADLEVEPAVALTIPQGPGAKHSLVLLPCSECAFPPQRQQQIEDVNRVDDAFRTQGGAKSIVVNVTVSADGHRLEINREPIYPMGIQLEISSKNRVYVDQVDYPVSIEDLEAGKAQTTPVEVTSSGVSYQHAEAISPEGNMIIPIQHTIYSLEGQAVMLAEVHIKLLKTSEGEIFISDIAMEPVHAPSTPAPADGDDDSSSKKPHPHQQGHHEGPAAQEPEGGETECGSLPARLCRIKHLLEEKFNNAHGFRKAGFKKGGCHGKKGGKAPGPHYRPQHMGMHASHDAPHRGYHFMHSFAHGLTAVLVPTMAGVAVGMVVSLFGLCFGRLLGFLWFRHARSARRGAYRRVQLEDGDAVGDESDMEKTSAAVILEQSEPLPVYEEAPSYEDARHEQK